MRLSVPPRNRTQLLSYSITQFYSARMFLPVQIVYYIFIYYINI